MEAKEKGYSEHLLSLEELSSDLGTDIQQGLTLAQSQKRLHQEGPNALSPPARVPLWLLFLVQFTNLFMVLLMSAGVLCFILFAIKPSDPTNLYLGVLLFVVVFATCYETFSQEAKSDELMEKFRALVPTLTSVIREGELALLPVATIVRGDLVCLNRAHPPHNPRRCD